MVIVIQEFCNKGTLKEAIDAGYFRPSPIWSERLAIRSLLRTAAELARGLVHLHDSSVVHGDFKVGRGEGRRQILGCVRLCVAFYALLLICCEPVGIIITLRRIFWPGACYCCALWQSNSLVSMG